MFHGSPAARRIAIITIVIVSAAAAGSPEQAVAGHCLTANPNLSEPHVYRGGNESARGAENKIRFRNRTLCIFKDANGTQHADAGVPIAWSTAHVGLGGRFENDWVEVGWHNYYRSDGTRGASPFVEWGVNERPRSGDNWFTVPSSCLNATLFDVWRVTNNPGTDSWRLYWNCIDGVGYRYLYAFTGTGFQWGLSAGETGGRGPDTETHMADDHRELKRKLSDGSWVPWANTPLGNSNFCWKDSSVSWDTYYIAADAFNTDWGTGGPSC
jgi:hypothetical protein